MARFEISPDESQVWIEATSSVHPIHSRCTGLEGWLEVELTADGGLVAGAPVEAVVELPVDRLRSGNPLEERELRRRIDARHHPTIEGRLISLEPIEGDAFRASGEITFRGETRPHEDTLHVRRVDHETLGVTGQSTFDVRDFGMDPPRILLLRVHPDVTVRIDVVAVRAPDGGT